MGDQYESEQGTPTAADALEVQDPDDISTGKYLVLMVPDFNNAEVASGGDGTTPLNSYLRLGCARLQKGNGVRVDLGDDLAAKVKGFTDDTRNRGVGNPPAVAPGVPEASVGYDPQPTSPGDYRLQESAQLHLKGGWRDHSDGNRITTTRGDKVEVIRGNYKLLVLGRQDGAGNADGTANAAGLDMSGGIVDMDSGDLTYPGSDATNTLADQAGLDVSWEWTQDTEPTASGTPGDSQFRWHVTTKQGSPSQTNNPAIVNETWAYTIDTYVGSAVRPVHEMTSTTYVDDQTVNANVTNNSNTMTTAGGNVDVSVSGAQYTQAIATSGSVTNSNSGSAVNTINESLEIYYKDICELRTELDVGSLLMELKLAFVVLELKTMLHADIHVGNHLDFHLGVHDDICVGKTTQLVVGINIQGVVGSHAELHMGTDTALVAYDSTRIALIHAFI